MSRNKNWAEHGARKGHIRTPELFGPQESQAWAKTSIKCRSGHVVPHLHATLRHGAMILHNLPVVNAAVQSAVHTASHLVGKAVFSLRLPQYARQAGFRELFEKLSIKKNYDKRKLR